MPQFAEVFISLLGLLKGYGTESQVEWAEREDDSEVQTTINFLRKETSKNLKHLSF